MKILCFMPNYIGDILMTTPAIRVLKNVLNDAEVYTVVKPKLVDLIKYNPNINKIILKTSRFKTIKGLFRIKPDYVILFRTTFFNSFASFLLHPKSSFGIDEELSRLFLKKVLSKDISRPYRAECLALVEKFFEYLGVEQKINTKELKKLDFFGYNIDEVRFSLEKKLEDANIDKNKKIIVISPYASRKTKMLTVEQYIELIGILYEKLNREYEIVIVGEDDRYLLIEKILEEFGNSIKSLCGRTTLLELGYLFSKSSLVFSVDSGPAYISEAVGTKTVIFFTSTLPEKYGPFCENVEFIYNPVMCSPCYEDDCKNKTYKCVKETDIQQIIDKILNMLKDEKNFN